MVGVQGKYKYEISFNNETNYYQFYPNRGMKLKYERDENNIYYRELPTSIIISRWVKDSTASFVNQTIFDSIVNDYFNPLKYNYKNYIKITDIKNSSEKYKCFFYNHDCKLNLDNGTVEITPRPLDVYQKFKEIEDIEINILSLNITKKNPKLTAESVSVYGFEPDSGGCPPTGYDWLANNYKLCGIIDPVEPNLSLYYTPYNLNINCSYFLYIKQRIYLRPEPITGWTQVGGGLNPYWEKASCETEYINHTFQNFMYLYQVTQAVLDYLNTDYDLPSYTYVSEFFRNSTNPYPYINYITGNYPNNLWYLMIGQKSDAKDPDASNPATIARITFAQLMSLYREMFNAYWFIDPNGDFRIEHRRYFEYGMDIDDDILTYDIDLTNTGKYNPQFIKSTQNWRYDNTFRKAEKWAFMEYGDDYWQPEKQIEYDIDGDGEISHDLGMFTTNIEYILNEVDQIADDGFVILDCDQSQTIRIEQIAFMPQYVLKANGHLCSLNLLNKYFRRYRQLKQAYIYGQSAVTQFESETKKRIQANISFLYNDLDGFDPLLLKKTTFITKDYEQTTNEGEVELATHDLETDFITMTLRYYDDIVDETCFILWNATDNILINATDSLKSCS